jgi:hypothetical protein
MVWQNSKPFLSIQPASLALERPSSESAHKVGQNKSLDSVLKLSINGCSKIFKNLRSFTKQSDIRGI